MVGLPSDSLIAGFSQLRYALRALASANEAISRSHGLTPQQFQAMLVIFAWSGPMALKDLANQLFLKHSAVVQLFLRLERTGYVRRDRSPVDGRVVLVELTTAGHDLTQRVAGQQIHLIHHRGSELRGLLQQMEGS